MCISSALQSSTNQMNRSNGEQNAQHEHIGLVTRSFTLPFIWRSLPPIRLVWICDLFLLVFWLLIPTRRVSMLEPISLGRWLERKILANNQSSLCTLPYFLFFFWFFVRLICCLPDKKQNNLLETVIITVIFRPLIAPPDRKSYYRTRPGDVCVLGACVCVWY